MNSEKILSSRGIRPSVTRLMIYDFVKGTKSHPTVDDIYQKLKPKAPTLSRTTVYNTVKLFSQQGLFKTLTIDAVNVRYDADIAYHGHFRCERCGKVFDFTVEPETESGLDGFLVTQREIFFSGYCNECKNLI